MGLGLELCKALNILYTLDFTVSDMNNYNPFSSEKYISVLFIHCSLYSICNLFRHMLNPCSSLLLEKYLWSCIPELYFHSIFLSLSNSEFNSCLTFCLFKKIIPTDLYIPNLFCCLFVCFVLGSAVLCTQELFLVVSGDHL